MLGGNLIFLLMLEGRARGSEVFKEIVSYDIGNEWMGRWDYVEKGFPSQDGWMDGWMAGLIWIFGYGMDCLAD